jgi:hypothetical protein
MLGAIPTANRIYGPAHSYTRLQRPLFGRWVRSRSKTPAINDGRSPTGRQRLVAQWHQRGFSGGEVAAQGCGRTVTCGVGRGWTYCRQMACE